MKQLSLNIQVPSTLYLKNPDSSTLGREIVRKSIELINKMGFESFTFKKLSKEIQSTESSVYRYFQSKHALLIYLTNWYWMWIDYQIVLSTINVDDTKLRLQNAISTLTRPLKIHDGSDYIDIEVLDKIIIAESIKAYHTINVDNENKKGFFEAYKNVVNRVADLIFAITPSCPFPHMLISTVIEGAHQQRFFAEHMPYLTDTNPNKDTITEFYSQMVLKMLS